MINCHHHSNCISLSYFRIKSSPLLFFFFFSCNGKKKCILKQRTAEFIFEESLVAMELDTHLERELQSKESFLACNFVCLRRNHLALGFLTDAMVLLFTQSFLISLFSRSLERSRHFNLDYLSKCP